MNNQLTTIDFRGATLVAVRGDTPEMALVAMKPVVEGMGLDWEAQRKRINAHPVMGSAPSTKTVQLPGDTQAREHLFMPLGKINFFLATLNPKLIKDEAIRLRVISYQKECADVLFQHFSGSAVARSDNLSPDNRQIIGGISKAVISKALAILRTELRGDLAALKAEMAAAIEGFDQTQGIVTNYRPMLDVLRDEGVTPKSRRPMSQRCSSKIKRWCAATQREKAIRISRETGRYLFHIDAIRDWLDAEGRTLIRAHKDKIAGQGVLRLIPDRQDRP